MAKADLLSLMTHEDLAVAREELRGHAFPPDICCGACQGSGESLRTVTLVPADPHCARCRGLRVEPRLLEVVLDIVRTPFI